MKLFPAVVCSDELTAIPVGALPGSDLAERQITHIKTLKLRASPWQPSVWSVGMACRFLCYRNTLCGQTALRQTLLRIPVPTMCGHFVHKLYAAFTVFLITVTSFIVPLHDWQNSFIQSFYILLVFYTTLLVYQLVSGSYFKDLYSFYLK
jgi:hypothetical protein